MKYPEGSLESYLEDLRMLISEGDLNLDQVDELSKLMINKESKEYLLGLKAKSKPETLLSDKFFNPILSKILSVIPQPKIGSGWADYFIQDPQIAYLPVVIELKPLHKLDGKINKLSKELNDLQREYQNKKSNQIVKYLVGSNASDYVVLTNLDDIYYFNRSAITSFEPFLKEKFENFINDLKRSNNVWDVVRRKDEAIPKRDLDKQFFNDLKNWYSSLSLLEWIGDPEENSVLLINKLIFVLTLEDIGAIDFRYTLDEYENIKKLYFKKGSFKVLEKFFKELDDFLYIYYDTELFDSSSNIIEKLAHKKENFEKAVSVLESLIGYNLYSSAFTKGLFSYNYRDIDEDIFGKSYEMFLAEERKDFGIFYTPKKITSHMASQLVDYLFKKKVDKILEDIDNGNLDLAKEEIKEILKIKILDPACGSGTFLVSCFRKIFEEYKRIDEKTHWILEFKRTTLDEPEDINNKRKKTEEIRRLIGLSTSFDPKRNYRGLISKIIVTHLYGVDLDEKALNIAKVNIWKEAIKLDPNSFIYRSLPEEENHILPNLRLNLVCGDSLLSPKFNEVIDYLSNNFKDDIREMMKLWSEYLENPTNPKLVEDIITIKEKIKKSISDTLGELSNKKPLLYPLEFFFNYFDTDGNPLPENERGFSGVIGNPPWNNLKPTKKEFAQKYPEIFGDVSKYSISGKDFEKLFNSKISDPVVNAKWIEYSSNISFMASFITQNYSFRYKGDPSLQKAFLERFMNLSKDAFSILVPSNFHTDEGTYLLRKEILNNWQLHELISFENRRKVWFPDVHPQFKFDMLFVTKEKIGKSFKAAFYVNDWNQVDNSFDYPIDLISKISPYVLGITEFRTTKDIEIITKIRRNHRTLKELNLRINREIDETNDKDLFNTSEEGLICYEGKMINQYNPNFSKNRYWINEREGRKRLINKQIKHIIEKLRVKSNKKKLEENIRDKIEKGEILMDYEVERFVFRTIASSTNERTLISSIVPSKVFLINSLDYIEPFNYKLIGEEIKQEYIGDYNYYLMALFNSFTLDYYIRQRVSANLNFFFIDELPIPDAPEFLMQKIIAISKELIQNNTNRELRAKLEILIAKELFGLNKDDIIHILDSFVYGNIDEELIKMIKENY